MTPSHSPNCVWAQTCTVGLLSAAALRRHTGAHAAPPRLRKHNVVTVLLNTEYDVKYAKLDAARSTSRALSTRIAEVDDPDKPDGAEKPVGNDSGYLWKLYSYWHFYQRDGGVYMQLEAVSLTRGIPPGFGWLIRPFITSIPQESLAFTLTHTRDALQR